MRVCVCARARSLTLTFACVSRLLCAGLREVHLPCQSSCLFFSCVAWCYYGRVQDNAVRGIPSASFDMSGLLPPAPVVVKPIDPKLLHIFWFRDMYPALLAAPGKRRSLIRQMDRWVGWPRLCVRVSGGVRALLVIPTCLALGGVVACQSMNNPRTMLSIFLPSPVCHFIRHSR